MSTSNTPRTDAEENHSGFVLASFARQLERELSAARWWITGDSVLIGKLQSRISDLEAQIERDAWAISPAMAQARINQLAADLARVTAERDEAKSEADSALDTCARTLDERDALRARVAELDERAERYRLKTLSQDARVAELEAALERIKAATGDEGETWENVAAWIACVAAAAISRNQEAAR